MTLKRLLLLFSHHFRSFWIILAIGYFLIQQKTPFIFPILQKANDLSISYCNHQSPPLFQSCSFLFTADEMSYF